MVTGARSMSPAIVPILILMFSNLWADTSSVDRLITADEKLTAKRAINVEDMFSLNNLGGHVREGLSVSPDGQAVAFQMHSADVEENNYTVDWYALDLTEETGPISIGTAGDPLLFRAKVGTKINGSWRSTNPAWSPDSQWVAYRRMDDGVVQVWRSSRDGGTHEQLTESDVSVDAFYWSEDGRQVWFETDAAPERQAEYLRSRWDGGLRVDDEKFNPRSGEYRMVPYEANYGSPSLWVLDLSSGQTRPATEEETQSHFDVESLSIRSIFRGADRAARVPGRPHSSAAVASYDGEYLAWIEKVDTASRGNSSNQLHVRLPGRPTSLDVRCELDECIGLRASGKLWWSRDGSEVIFRRWGKGTDRGTIFVYAWHVDNNAVRRIYADNSPYLSACSSTGHSLICFSDEPTRPRTLVEISFADGSLAEIYDPNPQFDEIQTGNAHRVVWKNEFGAETFGWVVKPTDYEASKRYPLVIVQYNASECFKGGTGSEYPSQLFAAEGFVVLCTQHPPFVAPTDTADWQDSYNYYLSHRQRAASLDSAIDLLDEKGLIDPAKVGITGLSSGVDAMSYALSHSNKFAAAIAAGLDWSPVAYYYLEASKRPLLREAGFGRLGTADDKFFAEMSPGLNASEVSAPILIQVSDDEVFGAMFNYVTLTEEGHAIDMYVFNDEYHIKWHPRNRKAVAIRSVDWMRFWLKGEEDSSPAKAEQYALWRAMQEKRTAVRTPATSGVGYLPAQDHKSIRFSGERSPVP